MGGSVKGGSTVLGVPGEDPWTCNQAVEACTHSEPHVYTPRSDTIAESGCGLQFRINN